MNEGQIKTKIFLMQAVDWSLLIAVISVGLYSILYDAGKHKLLIFAAIFGLFLVNKLGNFTVTTIARLRVDLEKQRRLDKLDK